MKAFHISRSKTGLGIYAIRNEILYVFVALHGLDRAFHKKAMREYAFKILLEERASKAKE